VDPNGIEQKTAASDVLPPLADSTKSND